MSLHAKFSPSKMQRIIACPGSVALESSLPDKRSEYADEGTVAHEVASVCLKKGVDAVMFLGRTADVSTEGIVIFAIPPHEGRFVITEQFAESVQIYLDSVRRLSHGKLLFVEQRVEFSQTVGVINQFGTSDVIIIDVANSTLLIGDLKFGMGVKVYAKGNEQMLTYAVGVLETFAEVLPPITKIQLLISQPRLDHEDLWEYDMAEIERHRLAMFGAVVLANAALDDYEADRELSPKYFKAGDKQCKFCKAKAFCPTLAATVAGAMDCGFDDLDTVEGVNKLISGPSLRAAGADVIGARFGMLDLVEEWVKATRAEVERMVFAGMKVVGPDGLDMKLIEGKKGNREWADKVTAEALLIGHLSAEKAYRPREIITASAAAAILDKKKTAATWGQFKALIKQAPGRPKVALGSDKGVSYTGEAKECEFRDLSGDPPTWGPLC